MRLKLIADNKIPFVKDFFSPHVEITLLPSEKMVREQLQEATLLLVRTVTTVNSDLLKDTPIRWVGSSATGMDHIDINWLKNNQIELATAAGANAKAVAEYVLCTLAALKKTNFLKSTQNCAGIVGYGRIGKIVADYAQSIGFHVLCFDPLVKNSEKNAVKFVDSLEALCRRADIITLHTPLTKTGPHPTYHMMSDAQLSQMKPGSILINTARGSVIDQSALLRANHLHYCLDVWENEPHISLELLNKVVIGTPHIAGYSQPAKYRATQILFENAAEFFKWPISKTTTSNASFVSHTLEDYAKLYNPLQHTQVFRNAFINKAVAEVFINARNNYSLREEF